MDGLTRLAANRVSRPRPIVAALVGDLHCNSTVGLCPVDGVELDDGGRYRPRPHGIQAWLWANWLDYWQRVQRVAAVEGEMAGNGQPARVWVVLNGDLVEGLHHRSTQVISANLEVQHRIAMACLAIPAALSPDRWFVIRGTEAHVAPSAQHEEAIARELGAVVDPETGRSSWWHWVGEINGTLVDVAHHGNMGRLPWTRGNLVGRTAAELLFEAVRIGHRPPALAVRSHNHRRHDTGAGNAPTRVMALPAWQMSTAFGHRVAPNSLPDIGGAIGVFRGPGDWSAEIVDYRPAQRAPWTEEVACLTR